MDEHTTQTTRNILTTPGKGHTTILTSFRRNGMGVGSPVGTVASQGKLYFMTPADTWKVKRLASNPRVTVAPGTFKGEALGPALEGTARRLTGSEFKRARDLLRVECWATSGASSSIYDTLAIKRRSTKSHSLPRVWIRR